MIETRMDRDKLVEATECCRDIMAIEDIDKIVAKPNNVMFISGNDVGLCIWDYPGAYTGHWYYPDSRGRKAIELGLAMTNKLFAEHGAKIIRALIREELRASRWLARQVGFKSCGFVMFPDNDNNEFLYKTEDMYMKGIQ